MNYSFTQIFVPTTKYITGGNGFDVLVPRQLGVYERNASGGWSSANYSTGTTAAREVLIAVGTSSTKFGSFKTPTLRKGKVLSITRTPADATTVRQQITYVGFDEVNDFKSPILGCGEEYTLTLKIDEYWSKGLYQPMIQESVRAMSTPCSECGGNCDAISPFAVTAELTAKINSNPLLSKYVQATHVFKGSAPAFKYVLTLPDAGDSTAENVVLAALQAYYPSGTYGAIAITTTDTDGDTDADALGNTLFEIASPLVAVEAMPYYLNVGWEKVQTSAGSVTASGIKLEGKALDAFGNACVPDAVPYVFNLVRFQVVASKGPFTTQDFDINDIVSPFAVTKTQEIRYAIGAGSAMAELERHFFRNNLPNVAESVYYWNPIYNEDVNQFLLVNSSLLYNVLTIDFLDDSAVGFEKKSTNSHELLVFVATGDDSSTSLTTQLAAYLAPLLG